MLHLPSYHLGRTLARFDIAAGRGVKKGGDLVAALLSLPHEGIEGFETRGGLPLFPFSLIEGYQFEVAKRPMLAATNRLSMAASAIWRFRQEQHRDYDMDGSGECGPMIARSHHRAEVRTLAEYGFTPEQYNALLDDRLGRTGWHAYQWSCELGVEPDEEWEDNNTFVCTLGYPGHPEAEYSSVAYLKGA